MAVLNRIPQFVYDVGVNTSRRRSKAVHARPVGERLGLRVSAVHCPGYPPAHGHPGLAESSASCRPAEAADQRRGLVVLVRSAHPPEDARRIWPSAGNWCQGRHPSFEAVAAEHQARHGMPALQGGSVQYARVLALGSTVPRPPAACRASRDSAGPGGTRSRVRAPLTWPPLRARTNGGQKASPILRQLENLQVSRHSDGLAETACKTVGSAYVGSNPTPATTSGNGPWPGYSRDHGLRWSRGEMFL
jgi:hypothetical protein